jgi:iron complex transport system substrate-binding protein
MVVKLTLLPVLYWVALAQSGRIVSTAPSITEMLYALGLGERVVGVTTFCRYPPEAVSKPKIGNYLRPDVEAILALRPDVVLVEKSMLRGPVRLPSLQLHVIELDDSTIDGICSSILQIGRLAGVTARAEKLTDFIRRDLALIRQRTSGLPRKRVLFLVGRTPGRIEELIAVGRSSYLAELVRIAGGNNLFDDSRAAYAKVSIEEVLARKPEVIVDMSDMAGTNGVTAKQRQAVVTLWNRFSSVPAVRDHRVYAVSPDIYVVPGPRVAQAARQLVRIIHPEAGF